MDDLHYFIQHFIEKIRRQRWFFFCQKLEKLQRELYILDRSLNKKCRRFERHGDMEFLRYISEKNIKTALVLSEYSDQPEILPIYLIEFLDNTLIICKKEKIAFFIHHEGWWFVCEE